MDPRLANQPKKACWTCRARRVRCDRGLPSCSRCLHAGVTCGGYGLQLSWPKRDDRRRAIVGPVPSKEARHSRKRDRLWVNASHWDIEMFAYLVGERTEAAGMIPTGTPVASAFSSVDWKPFKLDGDDMSLLKYVEQVAVSSLATLGQDQTDLRDLLIRMSLSERTSSSMAVLHAVLALSSLHRDGHQKWGAQHKLAALAALNASMESGGMGNMQAMQHAAAGMLLSAYEIERPSESYDDWLRYGHGAKRVVGSVHLSDDESSERGIAALLGWVHYHDVLSQFSVRHWRSRGISSICAGDLDENGIPRTAYCNSEHSLSVASAIPPETIMDISANGIPPSGAREILQLLAAACLLVPNKAIPASSNDSYHDSLRALEWRLRRAEGLTAAEKTQKSPAQAAAMMVSSELHRLATLTYVERASGNISRTSPKVARWTDKAYGLLSQLKICRWLYPLLIFGSEARSDDRRELILDLIERTEKAQVRRLECIRLLVQSIWVQDDLAEGDASYVNVSYVEKISEIVSSSEKLPIFV